MTALGPVQLISRDHPAATFSAIRRAVKMAEVGGKS
jgi:hypothetical protein